MLSASPLLYVNCLDLNSVSFIKSKNLTCVLSVSDSIKIDQAFKIREQTKQLSHAYQIKQKHNFSLLKTDIR